MFFTTQSYDHNAPITRGTELTSDEALKLSEHEELTPRQYRLLRDYAETVSRVETLQNQHIHRLLNPRSVATDGDWQQVHNLVQKLSYALVPELARQKVAELECQLVTEGLIR